MFDIVTTNVVTVSTPIVVDDAGLISGVKPDLSTFSKRLVYARHALQLTQEQLAKASGVKQTTIGNLESGVRKSPRNLLQLASALGVSAVWLQFGKGPMAAENPELRPEVIDLAQLINGNLTPEQVDRLRDLVLTLSPTPHK